MKTLLMIKPDMVALGHTGEIISIVLRNKFKISRLEMVHFTRERAEQFYDVHRGRAFFQDLVRYMTSGPVVAMEVDGEEAVTRLRELIGATDPAEARPGTIRAMYGIDIRRNAVHGSDAPDSAEKELAIAFGDF
jgi:nucleoside-diphosphate kinase